MKLSRKNHEILDSLRCTTFNDALTRILNYVQQQQDFKNESLVIHQSDRIARTPSSGNTNKKFNKNKRSDEFAVHQSRHERVVNNEYEEHT